MKHIIRLKKWHKIKVWWKALVLIDWSNIQKTYCEHKGITNFKESYNFLIKLIRLLSKDFKSDKVLKENIYVFFGLDEDIKGSKLFIENLQKFLGEENVIFKKVKKIKTEIWSKRKADFDAEIWCIICENKDKFKTFIILSGDGDFANLYKKLLEKWKQIIILHWATEKEKIIFKKDGSMKKKKYKKYNLWREIYELREEYHPQIINFPIDDLKNLEI